MICPHCEKEIVKFLTRTVSAVPEVVGDTDTFSCVAYLCPECRKPLAIESDPLAQAAQIRILRSEFVELGKRLDSDFQKLQSRFRAVGSALNLMADKPEDNDRAAEAFPRAT